MTTEQTAINSRADLAAAIATVEYSRQTHIEWAAFLRANPSYKPGAIGDAEYHEKAVREYDNVLAALRRCPECHPLAEEESA